MIHKSLAAFDIDRTLSREFLVVPIMRAEVESGLLASEVFTEVMRLLAVLKSGKLGYEDTAHQILTVHAEGLQGRTVDELFRNSRTFLSDHTELFRQFGSEVMSLLHSTHKLLAVTAEPEYMAQAVVETLDMDGAISSVYQTEDGQFTGKVNRSLAYRREKRRLLGEMRPDFAFGDSVGDADMLLHAHHAFCINPDVELAAIAQRHNWRVFNGEEDTEKIIQSISCCL
ncbi:MAG: haloacid dehalogenase-like hydrolase [Candidatus Woesebacteria bacterium]|jgi:phosphoserine phosphatase